MNRACPPSSKCALRDHAGGLTGRPAIPGVLSLRDRDNNSATQRVAPFISIGIDCAMGFTSSDTVLLPFLFGRLFPPDWRPDRCQKGRADDHNPSASTTIDPQQRTADTRRGQPRIFRIGVISRSI